MRGRCSRGRNERFADLVRLSARNVVKFNISRYERPRLICEDSCFHARSTGCGAQTSPLFFDRSRKTFARAAQADLLWPENNGRCRFPFARAVIFLLALPHPAVTSAGSRFLFSARLLVTRAARTNYTEIFARGQSGRLVDSQVN